MVPLTQDELYTRSTEISDKIAAEEQKQQERELLKEKNKKLHQDIEIAMQELQRKQELVTALNHQLTILQSKNVFQSRRISKPLARRKRSLSDTTTLDPQ